MTVSVPTSHSESDVLVRALGVCVVGELAHDGFAGGGVDDGRQDDVVSHVVELVHVRFLGVGVPCFVEGFVVLAESELDREGHLAFLHDGEQLVGVS